MEGGESYASGPYKIHKSEVFFSSPLSYAMVNLRPLLPAWVRSLEILPPKRVLSKEIISSGSLQIEDDCVISKQNLDNISSACGFIINNEGAVMAKIREWDTNKCEVERFIDLTADETSDLWLTAKEVGGKLERYHEASSLTFNIQDGPQAGQTVPHVHIHIIPRKKGDFEKNDEIYDAIDVKEKELKDKLDLRHRKEGQKF